MLAADLVRRSCGIVKDKHTPGDPDAHCAIVSGIRHGFLRPACCGQPCRLLAGDRIAFCIHNLAEELKALKAQNAQRDADAAVEMALKAGKITPAQKGWATSYALSDPKGFADFAEKAPQVLFDPSCGGGLDPFEGLVFVIHYQVNAALGDLGLHRPETNPAKVRYTPDLTGYPEPLANAYRKRGNSGRPPEPQKGP